MLTNRTSQAVERMISRCEKLREISPAAYSTQDVQEVVAVCQKFRRMEEVLQLVQCDPLLPTGLSERIDKALLFDPIS